MKQAIRQIAIKVGSFTVGDLMRRGYHPGAIRVFLRRCCREDGARTGATGRPVSLYQVRLTDDERMRMEAHNAGMSVGEMLEEGET